MVTRVYESGESVRTGSWTALALAAVAAAGPAAGEAAEGTHRDHAVVAAEDQRSSVQAQFAAAFEPGAVVKTLRSDVGSIGPDK
jgi:hypothetical protein